MCCKYAILVLHSIHKEGEYMNIGDRIKQRRLELGLSVDELAEKIKKNRATIYRYENNEIENLPVSALEPLANALLTTPAAVMGWSTENYTLGSELQNILHEISVEIDVPYEKIKNDFISYCPNKNNPQILDKENLKKFFLDLYEQNSDFPTEIRAAARGMMDLSEEDRKSAIDMINFLSRRGREAKDK